MRLFLTRVVLLGCLLCAVCSFIGFAQTAAPATSAVAAIDEAKRAGSVWLGLMDSGRYAEGWRAADAVVRSAVTEQRWIATMNNAREPLGKMISRTVQSATHTAVLPGVPDGDYVVLVDTSSFEHKATAAETLILSRSKDGSWRVAGYYIK